MKNLLKALTLPGLLTLNRAMWLTTWSPSIIAQIKPKEPVTRMLTMKLLPIEALETVVIASPESSILSASSDELIWVGI